MILYKLCPFYWRHLFFPSRQIDLPLFFKGSSIILILSTVIGIYFRETLGNSIGQFRHDIRVSRVVRVTLGMNISIGTAHSSRFVDKGKKLTQV